jgi:hypothetical protein
MVHAFSVALEPAPQARASQAAARRSRTNRRPSPRYSLLLSLQSRGVCFGVLVHSRAMWNLVVRRVDQLIPGILVNVSCRIQWLYLIDEPEASGQVFTVRSGRRSLAIVRDRREALQAMCSDLQEKVAELTPDPEIPDIPILTAPDGAATSLASERLRSQ